MKTLKFFAAFILLSAILSGCTKEGEKGEPGEDGNANVKAYTFSPPSSAWNTTGTYDNPGYGYVTTFFISEITQDILNTGAVLGYMRSSSTDDVWFQLPAILTYSGWETNFELAYQVGSVQISVYDSDLKTAVPGNYDFKIIVIEGTVGKRGLLDDVNTANYEETMHALGLQP